MRRAPVLEPFGETVTGFVDAFSEQLLCQSSRRFPELASVGFWMRRSSVRRLASATLHEQRLQIPRGTAFHLAPSNVDTIFVYSWFLSLLCGNRNIVRISQKVSEQSATLLSIMDELLARPEFEPIRQTSLVVRYGHDLATTAELSSACDIRVIWGGDDTVRAVRQAPLPPTAAEMTFANKYSFAVLGEEAFARSSDEQLGKWVNAFYNDVYWFGQMACSSPRLLLWVGDGSQRSTARQRFWAAMERRLSGVDAGLDTADYVNKRVAVDEIASAQDAHIPPSADNAITRIWTNSITWHDELHCGGGLFLEAGARTLDELNAKLNRRIQTVTYAGIEPLHLRDWVRLQRPAGIDRIVPFGKALDFQSTWDGYDLPRMFLREVTVQ